VTTAVNRSIAQRFLAVNRDRLRSVAAAVPRRQRAFVEVLPLLFHTNHPTLPGFVATDAPCGIAAYSPSRRSIEAATRLAPSFDYRRRLPREYALEAVYLMGSAGTLAYSEGSDFDVWLCHRPGLDEKALATLRRRAEGVSAWAADLGLEAHFFLLTGEDIRRGRLQALSDESSGSAQHHLLRDEFYRTALLLAGRQPLWWYVPPEREADYDDYAREALRRRFVSPADVLDFGGLAGVPANEFLGAALWQLYKGVASPYKSLLKLLLLEAYAHEFPHTELLSQRYKAAVYAGAARLDQLDPYVMMLGKVEAYLADQQDPERLELARRSLYLKTGQRLSRPRLDEDPRRVQLEALVDDWGWDDGHLHLLDGRRQWRLERVLEERQQLVQALTRCYRRLSAFARQHAESAAISERDMTILGRRLFAAFEQRAGKVPWLTPTGTGELAEPRLELQQVRHDGQESWLLFRPEGRGGKAASPLRRARSLVELLAWCHFNTVTGRDTQLVATESRSRQADREAGLILGALRRHHPRPTASEPSVEALSAPAHPVAASLFVNVGVDPLEGYTRQGLHLTTERLDPLGYGAREENLCRTVDYVYVTTWHEIFATRYEGPDALLQCLCDHLAGAVRAPVSLCVDCFTAFRGPSIAARVAALLEDAAVTFGTPAARRSLRWILKAGDACHVLEFAGERPAVRSIGGHEALIEYLGRPLESFRATAFEPAAFRDSALAAVYRANRPERVQLFYQTRGNQAELYVVDENGALFADCVPFEDEGTLFNPYARLLEALQFRRAAGGGADGTLGAEPVELFRLARGRDGALAAVALRDPRAPSYRPYLDLKVIADTPAGGLRMLFEGCEYSTLEHGEGVYSRVAEHVMARRASGEPYPIYVTDVDLPGEPPSPGAPVPTVTCLRFKAEVERRLNEALAGMQGGQEMAGGRG
jgi:adenylate cyclase class 1